ISWQAGPVSSAGERTLARGSDDRLARPAIRRSAWVARAAQIESVHTGRIEAPEPLETSDALHVFDHPRDAADGPLSPIDVNVAGRLSGTLGLEELQAHLDDGERIVDLVGGGIGKGGHLAQGCCMTRGLFRALALRDVQRNGIP